MEKPNFTKEVPDGDIESQNDSRIKCVKSYVKEGFTIMLALTMSVPVLKVKHDTYKWEKNNDDTFDKLEKVEIQSLEDSITQKFGYPNLEYLKIMDQRAFIRRDITTSDDIKIENFDENTEEDLKYLTSESPTSYPDGWVTREIESISFDKEEKRVLDKDYVVAGSHNSSYFSGKSIIIIRNESVLDFLGKKWIDPVVIAHELAHANDWENDLDLNIKERYELLLNSYDLMCNEEFTRGDFFKYHEVFRDGTMNGEYKATREYWADICGMYFNSPDILREKNPGAFAIVDEHVKKHQKDFDVMARKKK